MKKVYSFIGAVVVIVSMVSSPSFGQANIRTAGELSGIIKPSIGGFSFGYELSKSEAVFTYSVAKEVGKNAQNIHILDKDTPHPEPSVEDPVSEFIGHNYRITSALDQSTSTLFSGGDLKPGIGLIYEYIHNSNQFEKNTRYSIWRFSYEVKQNNFGRIDDTDTIRVDKRASHSFGLAPGFNWVFGGKEWEDNLIVGFTLAMMYNVNPTDDLKSKDFVADYKAAQNGVVQKAEKAWNGTQDDYFSLNPKLDIAWTPFIDEDEKGEEYGARFGLLSSISSKYNAKEKQAKLNFSIGPSLHPKWSTSQVLATVQAEFLDFTNVTGAKDFDDIFFVKFYVGIPLTFK